MGNKMKNQAKDEEKRIESKRGIVSQFLNERRLMKAPQSNDNGGGGASGKDRFDDQLCEQMLQTILNLLKKKLPVSDDMMLLVWTYEMKRSNGNEKENRLWNVLKTTIEDVLDHSKNKRNWIWFKNNIFGSMVCVCEFFVNMLHLFYLLCSFVFRFGMNW